MTPHDGRLGPDPAHHERTTRRWPRATDDAPGSTTESTTVAPASITAPGPTTQLRTDRGRTTVASACTSASHGSSVANTVEQVEVGRAIEIGTAGVDPVVVGVDREQRAGRRRPREGVPLDRNLGPRGSDRARGFENVGPGVDQIARFGARLWLLDERDRPDRRRRRRPRRIADGSSTAMRWIVASRREPDGQRPARRRRDRS